MTISDIIHFSDLQPHKFNIISSGCGTGKTYWATENLPRESGYKRDEIMLITSRRLTVNQMTTKRSMGNKIILSLEDLENNDGRMPIMTYHVFQLLLVRQEFVKDCIKKIKIFVFDECHSMIMDNYSKGSTAGAIWLRALLMYSDRLVVGLTATPQLFQAYHPNDISVVYLNDPFYIYKAQHFIITDEKSLPEYIDSTPGRFMVMCTSKEKCHSLAQRLNRPSFVLEGWESQQNNKDMAWMSAEMARTQMVPLKDKQGRDFDVLIATSTIREGHNVLEKSHARNNIKNAVCYFNDVSSIIQLCGRMRYDIDNLVVCRMPDAVIPHKKGKGKTDTPYCIKQNQMKFQAFASGDYHNGWYDDIAPIVADPLEAMTIYHADYHSQPRLLQYLVERGYTGKWLTVKSDEITDIVEYAKSIRACQNTKPCCYTFLKVKQVLDGMRNCSVEKQVLRMGEDGKQITCYKINYSGEVQPSVEPTIIQPMADELAVLLEAQRQAEIEAAKAAEQENAPKKVDSSEIGEHVWVAEKDELTFADIDTCPF